MRRQFITIVSILSDMSSLAGLQSSRSQRRCVSAEATHQRQGSSDLLNIIALLCSPKTSSSRNPDSKKKKERNPDSQGKGRHLPRHKPKNRSLGFGWLVQTFESFDSLRMPSALLCSRHFARSCEDDHIALGFQGLRFFFMQNMSIVILYYVCLF